MKGLTRAERRTLEPYGPPGEHAPGWVFDALVRDGRGQWVPDGPGIVFQPTSLGELALRVCPVED